MEDWVQPTDKANAYLIGDQVRHNGAIWENTLKENMAEPGTDGTWILIEDSIRNRALQAYNDEQNAWKAAAQAALEPVVGVEGVDNLDLVHTEITDAFHLAIWSDGDLALATRKRPGSSWEVRLAANEDGWTEKSGTLTDLADLGEALV